MKSQLATLLFYASLLISALAGVVHGADQSFADQLLGSPLLILAAIALIDVIAFIYHKLRK